MEKYKNLGGDSGVSEYEIGDDFVIVKFKDDRKYLFTYSRAGRQNIEDMKKRRNWVKVWMILLKKILKLCTPREVESVNEKILWLIIIFFGMKKNRKFIELLESYI